VTYLKGHMMGTLGNKGSFHRLYCNWHSKQSGIWWGPLATRSPFMLQQIRLQLAFPWQQGVISVGNRL